MNISISEALTYLLSERHFYAAICNAMQRIAVPGLGTMAVGIANNRVVFMYDPEWIATLSLNTFVFVLEHEMIHVTMDHIPRYIELMAQFNDEAYKKRGEAVYQVAMDCATNALLRKHKHFEHAQNETRQMILTELRKVDPEAELQPYHGMVLPENYQLTDNNSFDYYQLELMRRITENGGPQSPTKNEGLLDLIMEVLSDCLGGDHKHWFEPLDTDKKPGGGDTPSDGQGKPVITPAEMRGLAEQLRTQLKRTLKKVVRDVQKSRGLIPSEIAQWLEEYLADPIVPWWEIFTTRIKAAKRSKHQRGIQTPNRSLLAMSEEDTAIIPTIGVHSDPKWRIFFITDTSGSMGDDDLEVGLAELENLMKADDDIEVRYMQGDAAIHFDELYKSGDKLPRGVIGRGGTDFDAYFNYAQKYLGNDEMAPDMVVVYTDGWAPAIRPENRFPPEIPVVWLLTPTSHSAEYLKQAPYGEIIVCDKDQTKMWMHNK